MEKKCIQSMAQPAGIAVFPNICSFICVGYWYLAIDDDRLGRKFRPVEIYMSETGHVETCVLLYHKDYTVGEKGTKVTVEVGINK